MKGFQATGEASTLQPPKSEYPELLQHEIPYFFLFSWMIFAFLDPDPKPETQINPDPVQIRIRNTANRNLIRAAPIRAHHTSHPKLFILP